MLLECKSQCWETFTSSWCWDFTSNNQSQRRNSAFIILPPKPGKKAREFCSCWHQTDHFPPDNVVSQGGTSIIFAIITHSFHNEGRVTGGLARSHLLSMQFNWWHCPCMMENPGQGAKGLALNAAPAQLRPLRQHLRSTYARREKVGEVNAFYLFNFFCIFFFQVCQWHEWQAGQALCVQRSRLLPGQFGYLEAIPPLKDLIVMFF